MNQTVNYLQYFIEAFKSLENQNTQNCSPKISSIIESESQSKQTDVKTRKQSDKTVITKLNLTEADLIQFGCGTARKCWSQRQDTILVALAQKYDCDWEFIAQKLPGRNKKMCYSRYQRILLDAKEVWRNEEKAQIKRLYQKQKLSWREISFYFPKRTAKQLREHYLGYLRPNLNVTQWKLEEDLKLIQLFNKDGKKWKQFEKHFKGRTENQLKNRYYGRLQKLHFKKLKLLGDSP